MRLRMIDTKSIGKPRIIQDVTADRITTRVDLAAVATTSIMHCLSKFFP